MTSVPPPDRGQITQLLQVVNALGPTYPTRILCGDFNVTCDNAIVQAALRAGFVDAYADRNDLATFNRHGQAKRIDFLLHTPDLRSWPMDLPRLDVRAPPT